MLRIPPKNYKAALKTEKELPQFLFSSWDIKALQLSAKECFGETKKI